jgi:hypothetical protein
MSRMIESERRELDKWIAVNLFGHGQFVGLRKCGYWYRPNAAGYTAFEPDAGRYTLEEAKKHEQLRGQPDDVKITEFTVRHYTTSPADAMKVLDKLGSTGKDIGVVKIQGKWRAYRSDWEVQKTLGYEADTLEIAICLLAKGIYFTK